MPRHNPLLEEYQEKQRIIKEAEMKHLWSTVWLSIGVVIVVIGLSILL